MAKRLMREATMAIEEQIKSGSHFESKANDDALSLLEHEDSELRRLFAAIEEARADTVRGRALYGDLAKDIIQHMATREAALVEVASKVGEVPELRGLAANFDADHSTRRQLLNELEKMSRGVQGINLNTGQDFDGVLQQLMEVVTPDMERDLTETVPAVRSFLSKSGEEGALKSADDVIRHAPTSLNPEGPRWYERAPVISRALTVYDRLRDFPRAARHH
jgi:hypothetical protein